MTVNYHKSLKDKEALIVKYFKKLDLLTNRNDKFEPALTKLKMKRSSKTKKKVIKPDIKESNNVEVEKETKDEDKKTKKAKHEYKPADFIVED